MDKDEPATIVALARTTLFAILDTGRDEKEKESIS